MSKSDRAHSVDFNDRTSMENLALLGLNNLMNEQLSHPNIERLSHREMILVVAFGGFTLFRYDGDIAEIAANFWLDSEHYVTSPAFRMRIADRNAISHII